MLVNRKLSTEIELSKALLPFEPFSSREARRVGHGQVSAFPNALTLDFADAR